MDRTGAMESVGPGGSLALRVPAGPRWEPLENPARVDGLSAIGATDDLDVVASAWIDREVALDRVVLVVLADQLVQLVEAPALGGLLPAALEELGLVPARLPQLPVGPLEEDPLVGQLVLDLPEPLHEARKD